MIKGMKSRDRPMIGRRKRKESRRGTDSMQQASLIGLWGDFFLGRRRA